MITVHDYRRKDAATPEQLYEDFAGFIAECRLILGKATLADLEKYALEKGEVVESLTSGRQEMLESVLNNIMFSL